MDEGSWCRGLCTFRCIDLQDELIAFEAFLRKYFSVFNEDGAAMRLGVTRRVQSGSRYRSCRRACTLRMIVASTAMRTATPFVTWR